MVNNGQITRPLLGERAVDGKLKSNLANRGDLFD